MQEYPKWIFHKTKPAIIVHTKEEQDAQGPDWKETPAYFTEKQNETAKTPDAGENDSQEKQSQEAEEKDFASLKVGELRQLAIEKGMPESEAKELKKDQLIEKLKGL